MIFLRSQQNSSIPGFTKRRKEERKMKNLLVSVEKKKLADHFNFVADLKIVNRLNFVALAVLLLAIARVG